MFSTPTQHACLSRFLCNNFCGTGCPHPHTETIRSRTVLKKYFQQTLLPLLCFSIATDLQLLRKCLRLSFRSSARLSAFAMASSDFSTGYKKLLPYFHQVITLEGRNKLRRNENVKWPLYITSGFDFTLHGHGWYENLPLT